MMVMMGVVGCHRVFLDDIGEVLVKFMRWGSRWRWCSCGVVADRFCRSGGCHWVGVGVSCCS